MRAVIFALLIGLSFPAMAAEEEDAVAGHIARSNAHKFAACMIKRQHNAAVRYVIERPDNESDPRLMQRVFDPDCLDIEGSLKFSELSARAALAEALLKKDFPGVWISDFSQVPPLLRPPVIAPDKVDRKGRPLRPEEFAKKLRYYDKALVSRALEIVTECAIRQNAASVHAVLVTEVASKIEEMALRAAAPNVGACVDQGATFKIEWEPLRSAMAVTYFELLMAQKGRRWTPDPTQADAGRQLLEAAE